MLPTHLRENRVLNLRVRIQKILCALNPHQNFSTKYVHMLILALSATLESPTFKKSIFRNIVVRNRGAIKLQSRELGYMLNPMSQSNCVYQLPYLRYYALKFQFRKIDFSQKSTGHVTSIFQFLTHLSWRIG